MVLCPFIRCPDLNLQQVSGRYRPELVLAPPSSQNLDLKKSLGLLGCFYIIFFLYLSDNTVMCSDSICRHMPGL